MSVIPGGMNMKFDADGNMKVTQRVATSDIALPPSSIEVGLSAVELLPPSPDAKGRLLQNVGTTTIYLGLDMMPTALSYHIVLKASVTEGDGTGGLWSGTISSTLWTGSVNAISSEDGGYVVVTEVS